MATEVATAMFEEEDPRLRKSSVPAIAPAVMVIPPTRELVSISWALNTKVPEGAAVKAGVSRFSPKTYAVSKKSPPLIYKRQFPVIGVAHFKTIEPPPL